MNELSKYINKIAASCGPNRCEIENARGEGRVEGACDLAARTRATARVGNF